MDEIEITVRSLTLSRNMCYLYGNSLFMCFSVFMHTCNVFMRHEYEAEKSFIVCNRSDIIHVFIARFLTPQDVSAIGGFRTSISSRREAKPLPGHCLLLASEGCSCTNKTFVKGLQSHPFPSSPPLSPSPPSSPLPTSATVGLQARSTSTSKTELQKRFNFSSILRLI